MKRFIFLMVLLYVPATYAANPTEPFTPSYKNLPYLALAPQEKDLPPEQVVGLIVARASRICNFLKLPKGRYARRNALAVQTSIHVGEGSIAHLEEKNRKLRVRLVKFDTSDGVRPEVFNSFQCMGR